MSEEFESVEGAILRNGERYRVEYTQPGAYNAYRLDKDHAGNPIWWGIGSIHTDGNTEADIRSALEVREDCFDPDAEE
jgi:hypothetical protein